MRTAAAMRILCGCVVAFGAAGCFSRGGVSERYTLFADDAAIGAVDHDGQPWCAAGADPEVSVVATLGATTAQTGELPGLTPAWREPLVEADLAGYRRGLSVDVRGRCDGASFFMGRALLHPDAAMVQSRGVALGPIGNVTRLRLHFEPSVTGEVGGEPGFGYGDGDYGWYDPAPGVDDPGYDWGDAPPPDDGSGDPGGAYGGDPGGDYGGDPGGDSGGDSGGDFRRLHHRAGVALRATSASPRRR